MDRLISEKQVINAIKTWATPLQVSNSETIEDLWVNSVCELIKAIPSAEPRYYPPCEDCHKKMDEIRKAYDKIQSAEPKTGHWIIIDDCEKFIAKCSECGQIEDSRMIGKYAYCHCGARMESERNE